MPPSEPWWKGGVLYQAYVRSFADSNDDGVGDLAGLAGELGYLEWLGVDGIWLSPIHPSPNVDWGYDVADYLEVHPDLGTLAELDGLVAKAGERGIHVLLDLVPNHTSNRHAWFRERPEYYVWADAIPNNWRSIFGGPAWTHDEERGRYYLHNFAPGQPDLDWWSADVRAEFERILSFWFDRGIAGFRIDVAHALVKDRELRDDPPRPNGDGVLNVYSMNRPETHEILRTWRRLAGTYEPERLLLGEAYVLEPDAWASFYGANDELQLAFNFGLLHANFEAESLGAAVAAAEAALPAGAWPCWAASNHDAGRLTTRWCGGDDRLARCALLVLLGLRGTPVLYYGDELALANGRVPSDRELDCATPSRDPGRTPMPWTGGDGGWIDPWLPLADTSRNVQEQRADPASTLHFTRDLIALRRRLPELALGDYEELPAPPGAWAWRRGKRVALAMNLGDQTIDVGGLTGTLELGTDRTRTGERVSGGLHLAPFEGAVVLLD